LNAPPAYLSYQTLLESEVAHRQGRPEVSKAALMGAEEGFKSLNLEFGLALVEMERAAQTASTESHKEIAARLDEVASAPPFVSEPHLALDLLVARAESHLRAGTDSAGLLLAQYEKVRNDSSSLSLDLRVYKVAAQFYAHQRDSAQSAAYFDKAIAAAQGICRILKPTDQQEFIDHQTEFIEAYKDFANEGGKQLQTEDVLHLLRPTNAQEEAKQAARLKRAGRRYRLGFLITLGNVAVLATIVWGLSQGWLRTYLDESPPVVKEALLAFSLSQLLCAVQSLSICIGGLLINRLWPAARPTIGILALLLAILPWVLWIGVLALLPFLGGHY
jgi:hypothetical protein